MTSLSLRGITMPEAGAATLQAVMRRRCQLLVQDYLRLPAAEGSTTGPRIAAIVRDDPRAAVRALRRPTVGGLLGAAQRLARGSTTAYLRAKRDLDLTILAELAWAGSLATPIEVAPDVAGWPAILSIASRRGGSPPAEATLVFGPTGVDLSIDGHGAPWEPELTHFEIASGICFATRDTNPFLSVQSHPERAGNTVDLGGRSVDEWLSSLRAALDILREHAPHVYAEMRLALDVVIPTGYDPERHFSVSYLHSVGAVYLSLHPNVMTLAEALVHEWQHNKLHAVFRWDSLLANADAPLYASPVRPDPRPLRGVLMAVHAFLPIANLYEQLTLAEHPLTRGRDWQKRFREIVEINREGAVTVLTHGRATPLGEELVEEIRVWHEHFAEYAREHWPS